MILNTNAGIAIQISFNKFYIHKVRIARCIQIKDVNFRLFLLFSASRINFV